LAAANVVNASIVAMEGLVKKYTANLPAIPISPRPISRPPRETVLLTGSTGALGSHLLLDLLLAADKVGKIWAVNRAGRTGIIERQISSFLEKAMDVNLLSNALKEGRLVFVEASLGDDKLGLEETLYHEVRDTPLSVSPLSLLISV